MQQYTGADARATVSSLLPGALLLFAAATPAFAQMRIAPPSPGQAGVPEPELRDIAPPVDVFPYPPLVVALAIAGLLLVLGLVILAIVRWYPKRPVAPPPTPRALALADLEALRPKTSSLDPYHFSIAVSDVLRVFVGRHYGLHAVQQTSPEFLASLQNYSQITANDQQLLQRFLEKCDMIKFARIDATAQDSTELLGGAVDFVKGGAA